MKYQIPEAKSGNGVFLMQSTVCTVNLTNISRHSQGDYDQGQAVRENL